MRLPFLVWLLALSVQAHPVINEIVSSNGAFPDENGDFPDWIELFNPGPETIDLSGYALSDNPSRPLKWVFQSGQLAPRQFLVVHASGKDRQPDPAAALDPKSVNGLRLQLRADLVRTNDDIQVRPAGSALYVRRWEDASGALNHAMQSDSTRQPLLVSSTNGGWPALRFDGVNDLLSLSRSLASNSFTLIVVARPAARHEIDPESAAGVGGTSGQRYLFGAAHGGDFNAGSGLSAGTNGVSIYEHGSSYMPALAVSSAAAGPGFSVISVVYNAKKPALYRQGLLARDGIVSPRQMVFAPVEIGSGSYGAFAGEVAEILLFSRPLTEAERSGIEQFLANKYGLSFDFPKHTSFALDGAGESLVLTDPQGNTVEQIDFGAIPRDLSFGRQPDASSNWVFFQKPTPGASNTSPGASEFLTAPGFSHAGGFFTNAFDLALTNANPGSEIRYTLDGSEPGINSLLYLQGIALQSRAGAPNVISRIPTVPGGSAPNGEVFKGWVVRARAFKPGAIASPIATRTFWIDPRGRARYTLPVISLATTASNFFDSQIGIYVPGASPGGNYSQRGEGWERPVHVEFFETNGLCPLAQEAGVKIHGNTSQNFPIKGLDLDATAFHGRAPFLWGIFPDLPRTVFEHILLRPSGHDYNLAIMRDELMQALAGEFGAERQAARAAIVFLNGEYWGLHYLKEKHDVEYFEQNLGIPPDTLDFLEGYVQPRAGKTAHYDAMLALVTSADIRQPPVYADLQTRLDVRNYIDYKVAEIFCYRWDIGNHRLWRPATPEGRWRWLQFDNDVGWGGFWSVGPAWSFNMLNAVTTPNGVLHDHNNETTTFLLRRLLENPEFKRDFINRFADLLNTTYLPQNTIARINQMAAILEPEIAEHTRRWRAPGSLTEWRSNVEYLREYARRRPDFARQHIAQKFGLSSTGVVTVAVSPPGSGVVQLNTLTITNAAGAPWSGLYFRSNLLSVCAAPSAGFRFRGWQAPIANAAACFSLSVTGAVNVVAEFEAATLNAPRFESIQRQLAGGLTIVAAGLANRNYTVESSNDLIRWAPRQIVQTDARGRAELVISNSAEFPVNFYRLRAE